MILSSYHIHYKDMTTSSGSNTSMVQDLPPHLPLRGKNNNPEEWWNTNNFEIISSTYRYKVEGFLKTVSPYFHKSSIPEDDVPEPRTPHQGTEEALTNACILLKLIQFQQ
jgi:hypothetical protein